MKNYTIYLFFILGVNLMFGQKTFDQMIDAHNKETVPYVTVQELSEWQDMVLLDTREKNEFDISHLKNAIYVGYKSFDLQTILRHHPDKNKRIVVYCSVGIRSEDIGEELINAGYSNVYNLYGGIFEWYQQGQQIYNTANYSVDIIHGYQPRYSKWLTKGLKVYD